MEKEVILFLASDFHFLFSVDRPASIFLLFTVNPMPRGRGAEPRPAGRIAPVAKAKATKATKRSSSRRAREDSEDDDRPGPADAFYEAEDVVAPEDAGGASARRFDVSFRFELFFFFAA